MEISCVVRVKSAQACVLLLRCCSVLLSKQRSRLGCGYLCCPALALVNELWGTCLCFCNGLKSVANRKSVFARQEASNNIVMRSDVWINESMLSLQWYYINGIHLLARIARLPSLKLWRYVYTHYLCTPKTLSATIVIHHIHKILINIARWLTKEDKKRK